MMHASSVLNGVVCHMLHVVQYILGVILHPESGEGLPWQMIVIEVYTQNKFHHDFLRIVRTRQCVEGRIFYLNRITRSNGLRVSLIVRTAVIIAIPKDTS